MKKVPCTNKNRYSNGSPKYNSITFKTLVVNMVLTKHILII